MKTKGLNKGAKTPIKDPKARAKIKATTINNVDKFEEKSAKGSANKTQSGTDFNSPSMKRPA